MLRVLLCSVALATIAAQDRPFTIPLGLGSLSFGKNADGTSNVNVNSGLEVLGWGAKRNTTFTVGNGTFVVKDDANAVVNGTDVGGGGAFGVDKEGVVADSKVNLPNNKTVQGGLGGGNNFLQNLFGAFGGRK